MAFLDNSGDIILDAVLTDAGRKRLAMGDGSFVVSKFALGDDEIDYSLYVPTTSSGYQDLRILKLPVLEAFTNNTTALKNKLITYANNTLTHLPVIRLNTSFSGTGRGTATGTFSPAGGYFFTVNSETTNRIGEATGEFITPGYIFGDVNQRASYSDLIVDQGLTGTDVEIGYLKDNNVELVETSYIVEVDYRLLRIGTPADQSEVTPNFIDDDNVASYYFALGTDNDYFGRQDGGMTGGTLQPPYTITNANTPQANCADSPICDPSTTGQPGTRFGLSLLPSLSVATSNNYFTQMGGTTPTLGSVTPTAFQYIDTVVRITGFTTGYRVDIPIRILRYS
jgi:hypothetical protein